MSFFLEQNNLKVSSEMTVETKFKFDFKRAMTTWW